jgi:Na+/melibiose symporter-like transporter
LRLREQDIVVRRLTIVSGSGNQRMKTSIKIGYGLGQTSSGVKNTTFTIFLFFYYNQVLGVSGSLVGMASLLALIVDAVTDPMVGQLSDRFKSRWGRRHPFMLLGALPFGFAIYLLFAPPAGLSEQGLFAWMLGFAIIVRILLTLFFVPHLSLGAEMVRDYHERTVLISYRQFCQFAGALLVSMIGFVVFFPPSDAFPNGMLNAASYPGFATFAGILSTGTMLWSIYSTRSTIPHLADPIPDPNAGHPLLGFITVFRTLRQHAFRTLFLTTLVFTTIVGVTQTLIIYTGTYLYGFTPEHLAIVAISPIVGLFFAPTVAKRLSVRFDKKRTFMMCMALGSLFGFSAPVAFLLGLIEPMSASARLGFVFLSLGLSQIFFIALYIIVDSMLSDTIDQHELDTGRREEGQFFAAGSLAQKASFGFGALFAGIGLDLIHFPQGAAPSDVPLDALRGLAVFAGPLSMALLLSSLLIIRRYPLDLAAHRKIVAGIRSAQAESA